MSSKTLDPDPESGSGYGSSDLIESGSGPETWVARRLNVCSCTSIGYFYISFMSRM
jgi:hypothetical protein